MKKIIIILLLSFISFLASANVEPDSKTNPNMFVLSIGINKYNGNQLNNCVNDAKSILAKIATEKTYVDPSVQHKFRFKSKIEINEITSFGLYDEMATVGNVKKAFNEIIKKSKPNDYFVLFYAGLSLPVKDIESAFVLFQEKEIDYENLDNNELIKISELANLLNQISCNNQLIINESCYGKASSQKLISHMFESNPLLALNDERNRIIITVSDLGYDSSLCDKNHAPLVSYILNSDNIIHAFENIESYEYNLQKKHIECNSIEKTYFIVRSESDFRDILINNFNKSNSRGSVAKNIKKENKVKDDDKSKTYAFLIATDIYNKNQSDWDDLKNPINDANAFSEVLEAKYNVKVKKVYNKGMQDILMSFLEFKSQINENDKLIFFVAGHGYSSKDWSDGYIVFNDSYSLAEDITLSSYLSMGKLRRLLDGVNSKQVFAIFDVCYGASFEFNNPDLAIENYSKTKMDKGLDAFIQEKKKYTTRIVLASGQYEVPDYWIDSQDHSPFADKLIKAFNAENNFISPGKIFSYVQGNATTPVLKKFGKHESRGDFLLKAYNGTR